MSISKELVSKLLDEVTCPKSPVLGNFGQVTPYLMVMVSLIDELILTHTEVVEPDTERVVILKEARQFILDYLNSTS